MCSVAMTPHVDRSLQAKQLQALQHQIQILGDIWRHMRRHFRLWILTPKKESDLGFIFSHWFELQIVSKIKCQTLQIAFSSVCLLLPKTGETNSPNLFDKEFCPLYHKLP